VHRFRPTAIRDAAAAGSITLRTWQREALWACVRPGARSSGIITAVMGAGKSVVVALLCAAWDGPVVVTCPTQALVRQLAATIGEVTGEVPGQFFADSKTLQRITVVCTRSLPAFARVLSDDPAGAAIADGPTLWIADECHRTERDEVAAYLSEHPPAWIIGMSATPILSDRKRSLSCFAHEAYRYSAAQAIADGVLVPMQIRVPTTTDPGVTEGKVDADEWCMGQIRALAGAPCVIGAADIDDAEAYADTLTTNGIPTAAIHSRLTRDEVDARIAALRRGDLHAVTQVRMLTEGVDFPWLRALCLRTPISSPVTFAQFVGRGLRSCPGKTDCIVIDPWALSAEHGLTHAAAVAEATGLPSTARPADPTEPAPPIIDPLTGEEITATTDKAARMVHARHALAHYLVRAAVELRQHGHVKDHPAMAFRGWRARPASEKQRAFLIKLAPQAAVIRRGTQCPHLETITKAVDRLHSAPSLRAGIVSDLLGLYTACMHRDADKAAAALQCLRKSAITPPPREDRP
jgi:superfamily II DNA or RNA helicase